MNLPLNGRIVLIDNVYKEIEPIVNFLAKNRTPFNYYSGDPEFLPNSPSNSPRLLFLDLQLVQDSTNVKSSMSTIVAVLKRLIVENPSPYILVIWSKHTEENEYITSLEALFENGNELSNIAPVKLIKLLKSDYMDIDEQGNRILQDNGFEKLVKDINGKLKDSSILLNFIQYENIVHDAVGKVTNDISSDTVDSNWNKNTKTILSLLAGATMGKDKINKASNKEKLEKAFSLTNNILHDRIENLIKTNGLRESGAISNQGLDNQTKIDLNTRIHISKENKDSNLYEQGNLFIDKRRNKKAKEIISKYVVQKGKIEGDAENFTVETNIERILNDKPWEVMLDITPVCDYAQKKGYSRFIYGIAVKEKYKKLIKDKLAFLYDEKVLFKIDNENRVLIFDFRQVISISNEKLEKSNIKPKYKLRRELITDIQAQLSNQVNRPGISTIF